MNTLLLKELQYSLLHLFYPRLCEGCSKPLLKEEEVLCISCATRISSTDYHHIPDNETALRFAGRIPFLYATSYAYFTNDSLVQHLVHGLKYGNKKENGYYLGRCLGHGIKSAGWATPVDIIIPVPLHKARQAERGYNQSLLIAQGIAAVLDVTVAGDLLARTRKTESQTSKTRTERLSNMAGAFVVNDARRLAGRHVLLCDDVLTTGATIEACANALMAVENIKISIATVGIAVS